VKKVITFVAFLTFIATSALLIRAIFLQYEGSEPASDNIMLILILALALVSTTFFLSLGRPVFTFAVAMASFLLLAAKNILVARLYSGFYPLPPLQKADWWWIVLTALGVWSAIVLVTSLVSLIGQVGIILIPGRQKRTTNTNSKRRPGKANKH